MSTAPLPYLPPPTSCELLTTLTTRGGGTVTIAAGAVAARIEYALPAHATEEVREYFRRRATLECAPEIVARLPGGRVFGPGIVLSADGGAIARDVSLDFGKPFAEHWLLNYKKIRPPVRLDGAVAVIATSLGAGYCHWLLEELPRLLALGRIAPEVKRMIAHAQAPFAREACALHGWKGEVIEPARLSHYVCEHLVVPGIPGAEGQPTPGLVEGLREFVAPWHDAGPSPWGEKIYVTREQARRRRVTNESEVWAQLEPQGFRKVRLEELTWREQITAFRCAKVVVAPHGAGLANLAFCAQGTVVVELFNRSYVNGIFWQLAALRELDYRPVVAPGVEPLAQNAACGRHDIDVEVAQVVRAVAS